MSLNSKKVAVLVENKYEDQELWYPVLRLKEAGVSVSIVGPKIGTYESKHGYPAKADLEAGQARAADFDAVIVPGGFAPDFMRRAPAMVEFLREANAGGKTIAAICHAGWMLISAQAVKGKKVTSYHSIRVDMENAGGRWEDRDVVVDGNLITSRTPADLPEFMKAVLKSLNSLG